MKISEPQKKALKALAMGLKATYVDMGRFSHAFWVGSKRQQCTAIMKALKKKKLVEFVPVNGATYDRDIVLTEAGRAVL